MLLGTYTINDEVVYSIGIEELKDGVWGPYAGTDVQMEFVRIDPFVRTTLKNHNGNFKAEFTIPDVYGVYQFKVSFAPKRCSLVYQKGRHSLCIAQVWFVLSVLGLD